MSDFTPPTYDQVYDNELGRFGLSWPISYTVVIADGEATPFPGATGMRDPENIYDVADAGSGESGLSVFRFGKTYTVNSTEETILTGAGYTVV